MLEGGYSSSRSDSSEGSAVCWHVDRKPTSDSLLSFVPVSSLALQQPTVYEHGHSLRTATDSCFPLQSFPGSSWFSQWTGRLVSSELACLHGLSGPTRYHCTASISTIPSQNWRALSQRFDQQLSLIALIIKLLFQFLLTRVLYAEMLQKHFSSLVLCFTEFAFLKADDCRNNHQKVGNCFLFCRDSSSFIFL